MSEQTPPQPPPTDPTPNPVPYETPPGGYAGPPPDKDSITMGMLCHLLGIFTYFVGPVLLISAVQITRIVFSIIATVQANQGIAYRYPVTFRLIK